MYMIWGKREDRYPGEHAAELIDTWDEYDVDGNPAGFDDAVRKARKREEFVAVRVLKVMVSYDVERLFDVPEASASGELVSQ